MKKRRLRFSAVDLSVIASLVAGFAYLAYRVTVQVHYRWQWPAIPQYFFWYDKTGGSWVPGIIMQGLFVTLRISVWSTLLALLIGTVMGLFRASRSRFKRMAGTAYVELIRNIPVLVWIFIFYYFISDQVLPAFIPDTAGLTDDGLLSVLLRNLGARPSQLPVFVSGVLALAIYEGAYITEIVRSGIQSVDNGQWEASAGLGFTRWQQMRHVILPQAFRRVLPPLAGQFISTIKDSAIVSVISIQELTFQGMELMSATFLTFEVWITILGLYLIMCLCCSLLVERFELYLEKG